MHTVILKNDAVGDLVHSLKAINNIIYSDENKKITIFLSKLAKKYTFLINHHKVKIKILNYNLNIIEKIKLLLFLSKNDVNKVYILSPKNFYFYLPLFFRKIKFYAVCVNNINNYRRPTTFLRKFLFKLVVNERDKIFKRESAEIIQNKLTLSSDINIKKYEFNIIVKKSNSLIKYLPEKYIFFHYKKERFNGLNWKFNELKLLLNEFGTYYQNIILTKDIEVDKNNFLFKESFKSYDFKTDIFINKNSKVLFLDNIEGVDLFNVLKFSEKIIAFHGMMTSLGYLLKKPVLDFFFFKMNNWNDYQKARNFFYEFKPKHENYKFIIPSKNINKTVKKLQFFFKNVKYN